MSIISQLQSTMNELHVNYKLWMKVDGTGG
jgi:hypothetical protein